jgi:predicted nucleic acid-binding protein
VVLLDSYVWIDYFNKALHGTEIDALIDENLILINDIILSELVPFLKAQNQKQIVSLLYQIKKLELNIDWEEIIKLQTKCLKSGLNGIGIPDLIIAQNCIQNNVPISSNDKHFSLITKATSLKLHKLG